MYLIRQTHKFSSWLNGLKDRQAEKKIRARIVMVEVGNFGDHKSVGDGVSEMRINSGPGYRIYYTIREKVTVVLLAGSDKSTQQRDIKTAKQLARNL